jgi:hypothetical protein
MNCQESRERIADLLQGDLADREAGCLREHLHSCPTCWQEWQELNETWTRLGLLPDEQPSQNLRRDFYRRLEASCRELAATERQPLRERLPGLLSRLRSLAHDLRPAAPAMRLAAAVLVVAIGFGAGFFMGSGGKNGSGKIERLSREVDSLQQQMTLSLLDQPSASARLQGIALTSRVQEPEPSLIAALLETLDSDPSVNVRLSVVDALYLFSGREEVRAALTASLARQTSPLVQIALIDLLVSLKEKQAAAALKKLLNDKKIIPEVQQRAQMGISQII